MSRKLTLMFAAALTVGTASLAAASAANVQLIQSHVARINSCQDSFGGLRTSIDRTCLVSACRSLDVARVQKTVGPTIPVGCQELVGWVEREISAS
jgi:hypothetical protein